MSTLESFPWNAVGGDRAYSADDFRRFLHAIIPDNGVADYTGSPAPQLLVSRKNAAAIDIAPGAAVIHGAVYLAEAAESLAVNAAAAGKKRIDLVTLHFSDDNRSIVLRTLRGAETEAASAEPAVQNSESEYDVLLASLDVTAAGLIAVTDLRGVRQSFATMLYKNGVFPLGIPHGGTGAITAAGARQNLGAAALSHEHSAADITSGILPIARGGLGAVTGSAGVLVKEAAGFALKSAAETSIFGYAGGSYGYIAANDLLAPAAANYMFKGTIEPADFNSVTGTGVYHITALPSNRPGWFNGYANANMPTIVLHVLASSFGDGCVQRLMGATSSTAGPKASVRAKVAGSWTPWQGSI